MFDITEAEYNIILSIRASEKALKEAKARRSACTHPKFSAYNEQSGSPFKVCVKCGEIINGRV